MIRCLSNRDRDPGCGSVRTERREERERNGQQPPAPGFGKSRSPTDESRDSILAPLWLQEAERAAKPPLHHFDHW